MRRVYSNPDPTMAHLVRHALEQRGLTVTIRGERLGPAVGDVPWTEAWAEVWVADAHVSEAAGIVADVIAPGDTGEAWRCPGCGEDVEGTFGACWSCGTERPT